MERFAEVMQAAGAVGLAVGLFVVLPWGVALAIVSTLALAGGTAIEVGTRPRHAVVPAPPTAEQRRAALLTDYQRTASER